MVKSPTAVQETQVQSLGWEDPLEKDMATHSSILAWKIPWTEEPGRPQSMELQESDMTQRLHQATRNQFWEKTGQSKNCPQDEEQLR